MHIHTICMYVRMYMYICVYYHNVVISQVTGVMLLCKPVGLINQCTVMWNVSVL